MIILALTGLFVYAMLSQRNRIVRAPVEKFVLTTRGEFIRAKWGHLTSLAQVKYGVPQEIIIATIGVESDGNAGVRGKAGEVGLMQLLAAGALGDYERVFGQVFNPFDPVKNIDIGVWFLAEVNRAFPLELWGEKIQAYNTGIQGYKNGRRVPAYVERFGKYLDIEYGPANNFPT